MSRVFRGLLFFVPKYLVRSAETIWSVYVEAAFYDRWRSLDRPWWMRACDTRYGGADRGTADRLYLAVRGSGCPSRLFAHHRWTVPGPSIGKPDSGIVSADPFTCPSCQRALIPADECSVCGVLLRKQKKIRGQKTTAPQSLPALNVPLVFVTEHTSVWKGALGHRLGVSIASIGALILFGRAWVLHSHNQPHERLVMDSTVRDSIASEALMSGGDKTADFGSGSGHIFVQADWTTSQMITAIWQLQYSGSRSRETVQPAYS